MREYEMEVLEKYELEVNSTRRIRGAFYCDTKEGTMLLKETKISERRVPLLYLILNRLSKNPLEEMKRSNREMKKVRSFIRKRVAKNEFESYYLKHYEEIAWQAEKVTEQIERSGCRNLYERSIRERKMLHGDYNYHNVMILPENEVITNFERMRIGIQVDDLYYLLRKVMEKYHWKQKTGQNILEAYESVRQLKPDEREYLCLRLAYPEKFWKTASAYSRSNKAWLPEKSVEKLQTAVEQTKEKEVFLREVFE